MLVLRRKAGEAIVLNGVITIYVLAVEGERVKLGISAPPEVVIVRSELLENQGQLGMPGGALPPGPAPMPRDTPRPYGERDRERQGGQSDDNDLPRGREPGRHAGPAGPARLGARRRAPGDSHPTAPLGSGPLRLP